MEASTVDYTKTGGEVSVQPLASPRKRSAKHFRPAVLMPCSLVILLVLTVGFVTITEFTCRRLAKVDGRGRFEKLNHESEMLGHGSEERAPFSQPISVISSEAHGIKSPNHDLVLVRAVTPQASRLITTDPDLFPRAESTSAPQLESNSHFPRDSPSVSANSNAAPTAVHQENGQTGSRSLLTQVFASTLLTTPPTSTTTAAVTGTPAPNAFSQASTSTGAPAPSAYLQASASVGAPAPNAFFDLDGPIRTSEQYFLGSYLPTLVAALYGIPWIIVANNVNAMESFYQLSRPQGASASKTIAMDYLSILVPVRAMFDRQWAVVVVTMIQYLNLLIVPLAPEAVLISLEGTCTATTSGCTGRLGVFVPIARVIQVILGLIAALTICLLILFAGRTSAIVYPRSDPRSLAGLATIFTSRDTRRDFLALQAQPNNKQLNRALSTFTYRLQERVRPDGSCLVDLVRMRDGETLPSALGSTKTEYAPLQWQAKSHYPYRILSPIFAVTLMGLTALILVYRYTSGDTGFERFMDSQGFGVRFLFTAVAVVIRLGWKKLFQGVALMAPYCALSTCDATAKSSILINTPIHALITGPEAFSGGHYSLVLVSFTAILSEILPVTLATVPFNSAHSHTAFIVSTWLSAGIIFVMIGTLAVLCFYKEPELPMKPSTTAARLYYLCSGRVPDILEEVGMLKTKERDRAIVAKNCRYGIGNIVGRDGVTRVGINVVT